MKKHTLAIISILTVGSLFGIAYSASTVISDSGIITNNLTILGTCTGCASGEASYTNYNTIQFNNTLGLGVQDTSVRQLKINNDGTIISSGDNNQLVVKKDGTVLAQVGSYGNSGFTATAQSDTGKYQIIIDDSGSPLLKVYKNNAFLQNLQVDMTQFNNPGVSAGIAFAISPNGQYIAVLGDDIGGTDDRLVILRGT